MMDHQAGFAALPGLTLLECGVDPSDGQVGKAARVVRHAAASSNRTYDLALAILFLDRLGQAQDEPLIRSLALRLLAGQDQSGGWTYVCPVVESALETDLMGALNEQQHYDRGRGLFASITRTGRSGPVAIKAPNTSAELRPRPRGEAAVREALDALPSRLRQIPSLGHPGPSETPPPSSGFSDNSNTQFATLGLWVAGRHGVPVERSLALLARRFRHSQSANGSWTYHYRVPGAPGTPAMTGAGMLGLAVGVGIAADPVSGGKSGTGSADAAVEKGLRALGQAIALPHGRHLAPGSAPPGVHLYFLWTLERVAVLYNLREIDGKDWYAWGCELLLGSQQPGGSWQVGGYPGSMPTVDTCFALLFLRRANLVQDLSKRLEFVIDPHTLDGRR
jgi:hypothetical protein